MVPKKLRACHLTSGIMSCFICFTTTLPLVVGLALNPPPELVASHRDVTRYPAAKVQEDMTVNLEGGRNHGNHGTMAGGWAPRTGPRIRGEKVTIVMSVNPLAGVVGPLPNGRNP